MPRGAACSSVGRVGTWLQADRARAALWSRPPGIDIVVAAVLVAVAELEAWTGEVTRPRWLHALLAAAALAALAWRRRFPVAVLGVVVVCLLVLDPDSTFSLFAGVVIAAYTVGAELDPPRAWLGPVLAVAPFWILFALSDEAAPSDFVATALLYGGAWAVGTLVRDRSRRTERLAERARELERERDLRAEAARAEERARIARELHDVISHSISVVTIQAQAVRRRLGPGHEREAEDLRALETTARNAMAEMRRLFGILRSDGERLALAPQPGLDQLDALAAETRASGLRVEVTIEGERAPLPPGVDLAAYRIVQEGLTNARKHAGATAVEVGLRYGERDLEITVADDGRGAGAELDGGGHGLIGMRERAKLYGGTLEAGPRPGGGFRVRAALPYREARAR